MGSVPLKWRRFRFTARVLDIACANDQHYQAFCLAIDRSNLGSDARFRSNADRVVNRQALLGELGPLFSARTTQEWLKLLEPAGVPCGAILDVAQALAHPQVAARRMVREIDQAQVGRIRVIGPPVRLSATPGDVRLPPPQIGQHTSAIVREFSG